MSDSIPRIGLGTYGLTGEEGRAAMLSALKAGYRHIDTAQSYGTEENVGAAVAASGLSREQVFVTTKITQANLGRIEDSITDSLSLMGLDYADLVLIHWPAPEDSPPVSAYIGDLARAQDRGLARLIGVSNFTRRLIDEALAELGAGRLATNQVEQHVFLQNRLLADHCRAAEITVTAYRPLGGGGLDQAPELAAVADKHNASLSQIALAYLLALGSVVIPKSADPVRQAANLAAEAVALDDEDMATLAALDCGRRAIAPDWGPDWD